MSNDIQNSSDTISFGLLTPVVVSVDSSRAQMRLARAMGYPPSWRVVRSLIKVPLPEYLAKQMKDSGAAVSTNEGGLHVMTAVRDRIYAGHPASQPDGYYNHAAVSL